MLLVRETPPQLHSETLANSCQPCEVHQNASEVSTQSETTRSSRTMLMIDLLLVPTRQHNEISCSTAKKLCGAWWCQQRHQNVLCCKKMRGQRGIDFQIPKQYGAISCAPMSTVHIKRTIVPHVKSPSYAGTIT